MILWLEEEAANVWAAHETVFYDGWIIRFANGYTRRSNSVLPLYGSVLDLDEKIDYCESLYFAKNLPSAFKTAEKKDEKLIEKLREKGYVETCPALVMSLTVPEKYNEYGKNLLSNIKVYDTLTDKWIRETFLFNCEEICGVHDFRKIISESIWKKYYFSINDSNENIGSAMIVRIGNHAWVFSVVIREESRKRGYGKELMEGIIEYSRANGIKKLFLQVMDKNSAAKTLYKGLGFEAEYKYWYMMRKKVEMH